MSPTRPDDPTSAEWRVLSLVWESGPMSAREVIEALDGAEDWSVSTIKTLLRRLVDKGHLRTKAVGNSFLYSAARSPVTALKRAGESLLQRTTESTVGPLLVHLLSRSSLSGEDLEELRAMVDRLSEGVE